ncbi:MAG: arylsulfatase, partial [Bacteroidetes bacterium]
MKYAPFLLLAVYLWTGCTMPPPAAPAKPPNIILILADDMGYSDLGAMGSEIATPHLDRLAGDGLLFTQAYNAGRCCPTRASLLTGQYQHATGVGFMTGDLGNPHYQGYLNRQCATLAELLQPAGYATMMSGKWHLGDQPGQRPQQRGFDQFFGVPEGGGVYFMPFRKNRTVVLGDTPIEVDTAHFYTTIAFNDYACRFIAEHTDTSEAPFFLYLPHIAPHFPLQVPDSSLARYLGTYREGFAKLRARRFARQQRLGLLPPHLQLSPPDELVEDWEALSEEEQVCYDRKMAAYAAQITLMDQGIGRLVDLLEARGELDNTLILFLSDNGGTSEQLQQPENCESIGGRTSWTS